MKLALKNEGILGHIADYNDSPDEFWQENKVTISSYNRAKGHRASFVYIMGIDHVAKDNSGYGKKQLLTSLLSSNGWVHLSGIGNHHFYELLTSSINAEKANKPFVA